MSLFLFGSWFIYLFIFLNVCVGICSVFVSDHWFNPSSLLVQKCLFVPSHSLQKFVLLCWCLKKILHVVVPTLKPWKGCRLPEEMIVTIFLSVPLTIFYDWHYWLRHKTFPWHLLVIIFSVPWFFWKHLYKNRFWDHD